MISFDPMRLALVLVTPAPLLGSCKQLICHLMNEHLGSFTSFSFYIPKSTCLALNAKIHVLREISKDVLFLLTDESDPLQNKIKISCIGLLFEKYCIKKLIARYGDSSLKLQTLIRRIHGQPSDPQLIPYHTILKGFFGNGMTVMRLDFELHNIPLKVEIMKS